MFTASREEQRLQALFHLNILDTAPSESFDRITRMASRVFDLPIAAVSLTDRDRQWFKSRVGVEHCQISREKAPCAEVAETAGLLILPDLLEHESYRDSLLAASGIRFYAGAPLITRDGFALGAVCVLGTEPRLVSSDERTVLIDLAEMVMAQIELQHAFGRIEPTSGLPNRHQLLDDLRDHERDHSGALRSLLLIELMDVARLQEALRVLGPSRLDDLVGQSVRALRTRLGSDIILYHAGPAQFAWLAVHADEDVRDRALQKYHRRFDDFLGAGVLPVMANPVLGIAPFRLGGLSAEDVLRTAHSAAQDARNADALVSIYSAAADEQHRRRFHLISDVRAALDAPDQLHLVYQPRVDLRTGECVGAEALLRWRHPTLGAVPPGEFIPAVEQTELARPVTDWVIATAIRQVGEWQEAGIAVPVSVNVSPANLEETDFAARLLGRLAEAGLPPSAIEVEVTESALIRDGSRVRQQLRDIRAGGVKVAIDDFGTGYSSLSYLQDLPADTIKIDQSFVRNLAGNERGRALVRSMVGMIKGLDFRVVAEGIEDEDVLLFLAQVSCDEGQGYWLSRPLSTNDFAAWLGRPGRQPGDLAA